MTTDDPDSENDDAPNAAQLRAMRERDFIQSASRFLEDELKYVCERVQTATLRGFWVAIRCGPTYDPNWWRSAQEGAQGHVLKPALLYRLNAGDWNAEVFSRDMLADSPDSDETVTMSLGEFANGATSKQPGA